MSLTKRKERISVKEEAKGESRSKLNFGKHVKDFEVRFKKAKDLNYKVKNGEGEVVSVKEGKQVAKYKVFNDKPVFLPNENGIKKDTGERDWKFVFIGYK